MDINSYIITIVVMTHGSVIELNIPDWKQPILENVNLLSLAGDFSKTGLGNNEIKNSHINYIRNLFQRDLTKPTITTMETAAERIRPAYVKYINDFLNGELSTENSCKIYDNIQVDKAFGTGITTIFSKMMQCILPDIVGIYVISVHKKSNHSTLELIYPMKNNNIHNNPFLNILNMEDLKKFIDIFGINNENIINTLHADSTKIQPISSILPTDAEAIERINNWKVTVTDGNISHIRLSYLIFIIKEIVGRDKCKLNMIDYSCSHVAPFLNGNTKQTSYMQPRDIENTKSSFGGKNAYKRKSSANKIKSNKRNQSKRKPNQKQSKYSRYISYVKHTQTRKKRSSTK